VANVGPGRRAIRRSALAGPHPELGSSCHLQNGAGQAARQDFEDAFHKAGERHERVWVFISVVMLSLLMVGTLFFVAVNSPVQSVERNPRQRGYQPGRSGETPCATIARPAAIVASSAFAEVASSTTAAKRSRPRLTRVYAPRYGLNP
jgi:hypothetical protein